MASAFELLHAAVKRKLWDMRWEELRPIQNQAIKHLLGGGGDCVIASPTAGGKTEAAFLPVLSAIADDPMGGVRAMYIGPLKALINDQFGRLEDLCARMEMPVHKWHGDVGEAERKALVSRPGGILLITPESLEAMFVLRASQLPHIFGRLSFVVIDELHAFLGSPRGAQLRSLLYRLRVRAGCDPVRIGLSATIGNFDEAIRWVRPGGPPAALIRDTGHSELKLAVRGLWRQRADDQLAEGAKDDQEDTSVAELARTILVACRGATNLVFANAKGQIEGLADELATQAKALNLPDEIVVHHGSLSKDQREYSEARLRDGRPCIAVCSNTLEMGIDIGQIDTVVQVAAPWSVTSLVQRLGRSGRKRGQARKLRAYFVEDVSASSDDIWPRLHLEFLQGIAIVELMLERFLEPAELARAQWSTLVQQLLSTLAETGGLAAGDLKTRVLGSEAFGPMSAADFAVLLRNLGKEDLIEQLADGSLVLGLKGQRLVEHFTFFAAFRTPVEFRVLHGSSEIGMLPELTAPLPGDHVILAGRRWKVERVDPDRREIAVVPSLGRRRPKFSSLGADVHPAVHEKMRALLGSDIRPSYLDEVAVEILADARKTAAALENFRPALVEAGSHIRLFLWRGSKIQRTASLVFQSAGIRVRDEEVGLEVDASRDDVMKALAAFVSAPDGERLASTAEELLHARVLGGDKYDRYLPSALWRRSFVADRLDLPGAEGVARELLAGTDARRRIASVDPRDARELETQSTVALCPLVGLDLGGPSWTEYDDIPVGRGTVGTPTWGPRALLRDLELRLGLPTPPDVEALRAQLWAVRMDKCSGGAFYAQSLAVDRIGTARAVLSLRDQLVDAGWTGSPIEGGGERLDLIRRLEAETQPSLPVGLPDRLVLVERELAKPGPPPYRELLLVDKRSLWSERWRQVLTGLQGRGTNVRWVTGRFPAPSPNELQTDLGLLQAALESGTVPDQTATRGHARVRGDGSLVLLRAETSLEAAEAVAALTRVSQGDDMAIIRGGDNATLDGAFTQQQLATMGARAASPWRPLIEVLPLVLELMFEPRDPVRAIELLTLPGGPFRGVVGWTLAKALAGEPGIGGRSWRAAMDRLCVLKEPQTSGAAQNASREGATPYTGTNRIRLQIERVKHWLEGPTHDPVDGAPKAIVLEAANRVRAWLLDRLDHCEGATEELAAAIEQIDSTFNALVADTRDPLPRDFVRQVVTDVCGNGHSYELWPERAGRIEHVGAPVCLRRPTGTVVWWHFLEGASGRSRALPWRRNERSALISAGIIPVEPSAVQTARSESWVRVAQHAQRRLFLVIPERHEGEATAAHPFLDDLMVALSLTTRDLPLITVNAREFVAGTARNFGANPSPGVDRLDPLSLPPELAGWKVDPAFLTGPARDSATSVEVMLGCPLKWALRYRAKLRRASVTEVPPVHRLSGQLGHRLIEELHQTASLQDDQPSARSAPNILDRLISSEAAILLKPGMSFERAQLRRDLLKAVEVLDQFFRTTGYQVSAVEKAETIAWHDGDLEGRPDLLLVREADEMILDLKWGHSRYRDLLRDGHALQLAAYGFIRSRMGSGTAPVTGYYAIGRKIILTTDVRMKDAAKVVPGPGSTEVWARVSATVTAVRRLLAEGHLPVTGVRKALPLLQSAGVGDTAGFVALPSEAACEYCDFGPICGRSWQGLTNDL